MILTILLTKAIDMEGTYEDWPFPESPFTYNIKILIDMIERWKSISFYVKTLFLSTSVYKNYTLNSHSLCNSG